MILLVLLFIVVPLVELYVIIKVGGAIGIVPTLAILLADALLGSFLLRHQGRAAWLRFNQALSEGRMPHREVLDGVLIIFGGALLLTPGFVTDIAGLVLLIPPTRAGIRGFMTRIVRGRLSMGPRAAMWGYGRVRDARRPPGQAQPGGPERAGDPFSHPADSGGARPDDIEGSGHEIQDGDELPPAGAEPAEEPPRR